MTGAGGGLGRSHALELAAAWRGEWWSTTWAVVSTAAAVRRLLRKRWSRRFVPPVARRWQRRLGRHARRRRVDRAVALDTYGRVDVVVNNAGILRDAAFKNVTPGLLDPVVDVHLKGAFHVLRPAWHLLRDIEQPTRARPVGTSRSGACVFASARSTRPLESRHRLLARDLLTTLVGHTSVDRRVLGLRTSMDSDPRHAVSARAFNLRGCRTIGRRTS